MRRCLSRRMLLAGLAGVSMPLRGAPARLSGDRLAAAARYSASKGGVALLIQQEGKVLHESYANGGGRGQARRIYSGTKAFWGLAALAAVEDGLLTLDEPVSGVLTEWQKKPGKEKVTVRQLLDFTCGIERCVLLHEDGLKDRNAMAMACPMVTEPGKAFLYGPSPLQVFHELLKRKLAGKRRIGTPTRYLERRVLMPMGLGAQRYLPDASGNPLLAAGFIQTPAQWARMGELLVWGGRPVLRPGSLQAALNGSAANPAYAFGFWNNHMAGRLGAREVDVEALLRLPWSKQSWRRACLAARVPEDLIACIGSGHQRLFVLPSQGLVIVRMGNGKGFSDATFLRTLLA